MSLSHKKKIACVVGKVDGHISINLKEIMVLDMIQFLFQKKKITFGEMKPSLNIKSDHSSNAFKKIKKFL